MISNPVMQILLTVAVVAVVIGLLRAKKPATAKVVINDEEESIDIRRK